MKTYEQRTEDILQKAKVQKKSKAKRITAWCSVAASALLVFNLVMFVPYTTGGIDITAYADNEYYTVIEQLAPLTYDKPKKTNNFNQVFSGFSGCTSKDGMSYPTDEGIAWGDDYEVSPPLAAAPDGSSGSSNNSSSSGSGNENYNEVTNNQTKGVTEGDLFKRSDKHIYYLSYTPYDYKQSTDESYVLRTYTIAGAESELVSEYSIHPQENVTFATYMNVDTEMFLSKDCKTVTVILPCYKSDTRHYFTEIISLDVSDATSVKEVNRVCVSGVYISSRVVDGNILFVSNFAVRYRPDFDDQTHFLPRIGAFDDMRPLPLDNIICPDDANSATYTVLCSLNEKTLEVKDSLSLLSFSKELYVSENNLFVTRECFKTTEDKAYKMVSSRWVTDIYQVEYKEGNFTDKGSMQVDGTIVDRYCMDEYEGILRVFTNVRHNVSYDHSIADVDGFFNKDLCDLYCIDLKTHKTVAEVKNFAPLGESVRSARFYGKTAYVCTAEELKYTITDPVFAFDLSDYNNITYKDTGTIPGYSLSLIAFTDDTLLGIGYGDTRSDLKIEIYRQTENKVESVTEYISANTTFSSKFKAYFIDAENGLIGLATRQSNVNYTLLRYDEYGLHNILSFEIQSLGYSCDTVRATYIDGYLYTFATGTFKVIKL